MSFSTSDRFSALDPKDRDRLEALAKLDEFKAGQEILTSGKPVEWLYLIASGVVEVRAGPTLLASLQAGDLFGELESFAELPDGIRHVAREDTIVRVVPKSPLMQELKSHRSLATGLLSVYCRSISEKVRATNEVLARLGPQNFSRPPPPRSSAGPADRPPHLSIEDAAWLQLLGAQVEAAGGTTVVAEGDTTRSFFVIEEGTCEVRKQFAGGDKTLATLGARDLFGFMAFVDGKPRSASVVAVGTAKLSRVDPDALDKALRLNFTVGFKFLGTLCGVLGRTFSDTARAVIANS
jgi:CRP-like cAMP-binding protein